MLAGVVLPMVIITCSCGPKPPKLILDAPDQYALALREFGNKNWDKAALELQKLILNYPGVGFIDSAQYLLGMTYFNQKEYPLAIDEFNRLLSSFPTSPLADDATFKAAECDVRLSPRAELDQSHTQKALEELNNFLEEYPESNQRQPALDLVNQCRAKLAKKSYKSGQLYFKMGRYLPAESYFQQVLDEYPDTEWAKPARFYLAESLYKQKKYEQAKTEYENYLQNSPQDELTKKINGRLEKINKLLASGTKEKTEANKK
jgi:outer membrane protein assembly factor BamD